ncbi:hypothetical protein GCM10008944_01230 [Cytobacillus oceanisediminis]
MTSVRDVLAGMPDVEVVYTRDPAVLRGRQARWFPRVRQIAMHADLRGRRWRCDLMHELGHAVLGHPASCDNEFFDQRNELEADLFAAVALLPCLDTVARELATAGSYSHAAHNLGVIHDFLELRLRYLDADERRHVDRAVWSVHEGIGA